MKLKLNVKVNAAYYNVDIGSVVDIDEFDYLVGVVAAQVGNASIEACKAQTVAAHTAAYPYISKDKVLSDSSSQLQAFNAERMAKVSAMYPNVLQAVKEVRGELLSYNGTIISTCSYCHSNGGTQLSSKEVWGGDRAWLVHQKDPWDKGTKSGHGVGMSQTGAKYAASIGKNYRQILSFYYPGTTIIKEKEDETMASKVTSKAFAQKANQIHSSYKVTYQNGMSGQKSGDTYLCDCRGYVIWTLRSLGVSMSSTGTNWMIRNQMTSVNKINKASQLEVGMVVFKHYEHGDPKWNPPSKYLQGGSAYDKRFGQIDVYHVGIVISTSPLIIRHCSGGGIRTDTALGKWDYAGWVQWVTPNEAPTVQTNVQPKEQAPSVIVNDDEGVITANKVNLRKAPTKSAARVEYMNKGDKVTVLKSQCGTEGWYFVKYKNATGYVMAEFVKKG